jgi:glycosyltransferase involved in cell wall biosynthesis
MNCVIAGVDIPKHEWSRYLDSVSREMEDAELSLEFSGDRWASDMGVSGLALQFVAVVASRVGGIQDQIVDQVSGVLVFDPRDLRAFGSAVAGLLADPAKARRIGSAARTRVRDCFLGPRHLARSFELIERLAAG